MQEDKLIQLIGVSKDYGTKDNVLHVLKDVNLTIKIGEFVSIMGPSGSGKTTLMNIIGLLSQPSSGKYFMDYQDTYKLSDNTLSNIRKSKIGFVFQDYNLLTRYNVFENVALPMRYSPLSKKVRDNRVKEVLGMVGLSDHAHDKIGYLSGGQAQKVAIARALINNPDLILADEPTGNLDSRSATEVLRLMRDLNQLGVTIILVTHNPDIARVTERVISIVDGCVKGDVDLGKKKYRSKSGGQKAKTVSSSPKTADSKKNIGPAKTINDKVANHKESVGKVTRGHTDLVVNKGVNKKDSAIAVTKSNKKDKRSQVVSIATSSAKTSTRASANSTTANRTTSNSTTGNRVGSKNNSGKRIKIFRG